ncbi:MAG: hypothetical protein KDA79_07285 [Planctomycetaceae bacterium]|nr:hypothetical protein [Planctomycetaceae bacterium]
MKHTFSGPLSRALITAILLTAASAVPASAQIAAGKGFDYIIRPEASVEEMLSHSDFWAVEVALKPMRMVTVNVTDPTTGKKKLERIWYLAYRVVNRPLDRPDRTATEPSNELDPPPRQRPLFIPEFTLVTDDNSEQFVYEDVLIPEAQAEISRRERMPLKNSVEIAGQIPEVTDPEALAPNALFGVAMWRNIDPRVDFFTVYLTGFSSGYRVVAGQDGEQLNYRRTIVVDFQRPGDEFDQTEREFRRPSEGRWIYRPEDITPDNLNNELPAGADEKKDGEAALPEAAAAEE